MSAESAIAVAPAISNRTLVVLHRLIDYVPLDKPPTLNQAQVTTNRFNSSFYMHDVDEVDVMEVCQLLSYYLRARFDVRFDREPVTDDERAGHALFYSLRDFDAYYAAFKAFILRMYQHNQRIADQFELFMSDVEERKAAGEPAATLLNDQTIEILRQFKEVRKVFSQFFDTFASEKFDPAVLYERLFLERTCSAVVPLVLSTESFGSLAGMFDQLCYLNIQSVDYCNSVMPAVISAGFVVYSILYMCGGSELVNPVQSTAPISAWGKVNSQAEGMPHWLHAQTETAVYQREVEQLPTDLFNPTAGDTYVNKHDFVSTLLAQTLNRLFTRLIEWPMREDVSVWMSDYLQCDNIHRFFLEHGRNEQLWIRFRKRRNDSKDLPSVYVKLDQLHAMFDEVALASKRQHGRDSRGNAADEQIGMGLLGVDENAAGVGASAKVALAPEKTAVRERLENLRQFKARYVAFWLNGIRGSANRHFHDMFAAVCRQFVLATGGYNGVRILEHAEQQGHAFSLEAEQLTMSDQLDGLVYDGCRACTGLLAPGSIPDMFHVDRWVEQIHTMLFPYNFYQLTTAGRNGYTRDDLNSCIVYKMLEAFAVRRLTADRAVKMLAFFEANRAVCSFVVTQSEMIALWTRATQQLAFFKDFLAASAPPST